MIHNFDQYIRLYLAFIFTLIGLLPASFAQQFYTPSWTLKNAFENEVFIENKGQFDGKVASNHTILYGINNGGMEIYFTKNAVFYVLNKQELKSKRAQEELMECLEKRPSKKNINDFIKDKSAIIYTEWQGTNTNTELVALEQKPEYYTWLDNRNPSHIASFIAKAYKKLCYKNIYPNIDIEYYFDENKKGGLKYNIVLHPGADPTLLELKYEGHTKLKLDNNDNLLVYNTASSLTDHAPLTYYQNDKQSFVSTQYTVNNNKVGFSLANYDHSKEVVIDPWVTNPAFTTTNKGYTIRTDYLGNCYVMGGEPDNFEVKKINASGTVLWTHKYNGKRYGDLAVSRNGSVYIAINDDAAGGAGIYAEKLNSSGTSLNIYSSNGSADEMFEAFRISYNQKINSSKLFFGTGALNSIAQLDTNLNAITVVRPYPSLTNSNSYPDVVYLAQEDDESQLYATICKNSNNMKKLSTSSLQNAVWTATDNSAFKELGQANYVPGANFSNGSYKTTNGLNGMVVGNTYVYTYDGAVLKAWDKNTGTVAYTANVTDGAFNNFSGIAKDACSNVYVGVNGKILKYTSDLSSSTIITTQGDVYDVQLDPLNDKRIFVTGNGFVQLIESASCPTCINATNTNISDCNWGTATVKITDPAAIPPYTYQWNTTPPQNTQAISGLQAGTYIVTVKDNSPCPLTWVDTVVVTGTYVPCNGTLVASGGNICPGACIHLSATITGATNPLSYNWQPGNLTGANPSVCPTATTIYTLTLKDANGGVITDTAAVIVNPKPVANFSGGGSGCAPFQVNFVNNSINASSFSWNFGDGTVYNANNPSHVYTLAGNYNIRLIATNNMGCKDTVVKNSFVTIYPGPKAILNVQEHTASEMEPIIIFNNASLLADNSLIYFGDGDILTNPGYNSFEHNYQKPGKYCASLIVESKNKCKDSTKVFVEIKPECALHVPNAFSPNADKHNDTFMAYGLNIVDFKLFIFNRWGEQIFESDNILEGWNGKKQNESSSEIVQEGIYLYKINAIDVNKKEYNHTGTITLIK